MAMELKHLNPQHVMDVTGKAIDEISRLRAENAELQAENERLKKCEIWMMQHFYCEEVIACESAKNRRLKRALWLARADAAESEARGWYHSTGYCVKYDGGHTIKGALNGKGLLRLPEEWMRKWLTVERKCRAKAEEYK
jgi:hypothetical protein